MISKKIALKHCGASISRRELRTLTKRLERSERPELRTVARAIDKALAGEPYSRPHHEGSDYDPARCAACEPDLWVIWTIGVAFPDADPVDLAAMLRGLQGLSDDDIARQLDAACAGDPPPPPDVIRQWLTMVDGHDDDVSQARVDCEPGWVSIDSRWVRSYGPDEPDESGLWRPWPPNAEFDAALRELQDDHAAECLRFWKQRGRFAAPALLEEIRFGSDVRTARATKKASLRKEMDLSCLIK